MAPQLASAASGVLALIRGPVLQGAVLAAFTHAVIIGVNTGDGPRVVSLLSARAAGVPTGVRIAGANSAPRAWPGTTALVGGGRIRLVGLVGLDGLDGQEVQVVRWWNSRVPVIRPRPALVAALSLAAARAERGVDDDAVAALRAALDGYRSGPESHGDDAVGPAVDGLVGLGKGLTPGGDDVIAGVLTALHAVGLRGVIALVRSRLQNLADRTPTMSAELLRLAAGGHACLEALAVLRSIGAAGPSVDDGPTAGAVRRLLSVGHTSGADLATGLAMGLDFAMTPRGRADLDLSGIADPQVVR